jgi:hypothetical protein
VNVHVDRKKPKSGVLYETLQKTFAVPAPSYGPPPPAVYGPPPPVYGPPPPPAAYGPPPKKHGFPLAGNVRLKKLPKGDGSLLKDYKNLWVSGVDELSKGVKSFFNLDKKGGITKNKGFAHPVYGNYNIHAKARPVSIKNSNWQEHS